ncbi:MAG: PAS domain S-box protein [Rubrivivax sp.]|nr:MAG: PAS domain S-box protein [Rubrivivax sp.]
MNPSSADDCWFDLVPSPLAEFDEQGRWCRHNRAFEALVGERPVAGQALSSLPPPVQQLLGWDTPLALLGLRPGEGALPTRASVSRIGQGPQALSARVHVCAPTDSQTLRRILCIVTDPGRSAGAADAPHASVAREPLLRELTTILESSPAGIAYIRGDTLVRCNRRFERMLGLTAGTLTGQQLDALLGHDARIQRVVIESLAHLQNESQYESELEIVVPGLPTMWYALSIKRLGTSTNPLEAIAVISDITRIRMQKAQLEALGRDLALQADRTRAILDSVFVGIVTMGAGGISWMNGSARRMFGGGLADFVGQPLSTVATPDLDHPFRMTDYLDDLLDGQSHTFECQVVGRDGRVFWVVGNAVVTLSEAHERQITYALLDIERRRQAEARSAEAEATLKRIIEMAPMAISVHEAPTLRVLQANKSASGFMQRNAAQALGEALEDIYPAPRARLLRAEMMAALDTNKPQHREHQVDTGKGSSQIWDVNYLPLSSDGQPADQLLVVASDITEQRAAEKARLEAAIAQREMLVREVHHRIKNNLQGVAGLLQQIAQRKPEVAPAIAEVVGQVQAIAQVYGLQVGSSGPLRLHSVVDAIASSVQKTFGHPITLRFEGAQSSEWLLPEAESIPIALSLNELLTNAYKHSDRRTPVDCVLSSDEHGVSIRIRNVGSLPAGFTMDRIRGGVSGLGLVRALLPRRSSSIQLHQEADQVLTQLKLTPPGINLFVTPPALGEPTGQQYALWPQ